MEGFVQWMKKEVYQPRRPMRISDVRKKEMSWMSTRIQGGLKSYLFIPILQGDQCIGHFSLSDVKADAFTEEDEELLASVANHLSPAIRNATMFHESTEHATRLDIQNRIAKAVGSTMKPQELFQTIVREIREVVPCDRCTVGTIDRRNSRVHYWYSESDVDMEPVTEGDVDSIWWLDRVYEEKLPSNIFDYGEIDSPRARKMMESGLRSGLIVPILQDDQCIAHIALISSQAGAFSAGDESMLVSIADHMGLAMRNATLFSMAEKRASRLAVLNDLNQKITANLSLDGALKSIVRAVCDLTQGDHARILLVDEEGSQIYLRASHGEIPDPPGGPVQFAIGEGITGKVAETGEPYMVGDIQKDPSWIHKDWAREHGIHGAIFQPLRQGERVIGVITCLTCVCDFFTREELNLLESLASQAAVAIQNAQFHEEAQRSRDFFRGVVDDNATPIIVMDTERKITVWNDAAEKLYGYSADEMIGRGLERIIPEDSRADYDVITSKAIDDKDATSFETIRVQKGGTEIPVDITLSPITQSDGTVLAISAVHRDLTEQKRAQVEMTLLATVIEQAGEAIMITDTEGVIEYVNPAFTEITGFERDETIGQSTRMLKSGEMKKEFYEELWKTVSSGGVWSGQIVNKKKDGAQFTARQTISPVFGSSGKIENYVSILRDITYESGLEEKLRQS
jgi:PAS domain S-box-containing protein